MQFATLLALALPLVAAVPQASPTTSTAAPSATADLEAICESQAGPYANSCPQCLQTCATSTDPQDCYYSVFFTVNGIQAQCEAQGGNNCRGQALDAVCGQQ